jgi:hypothetical protein
MEIGRSNTSMRCKKAAQDEGVDNGGCPNPKTPKKLACWAVSQSGGASPNFPVITDRSSVAILSKRTTDGTLRPVPGEAAIGAISGPVRGTEVITQITRSDRRSLSRELRGPDGAYRRKDL